MKLIWLLRRYLIEPQTPSTDNTNYLKYFIWQWPFSLITTRKYVWSGLSKLYRVHLSEIHSKRLTFALRRRNVNLLYRRTNCFWFFLQIKLPTVETGRRLLYAGDYQSFSFSTCFFFFIREHRFRHVVLRKALTIIPLRSIVADFWLLLLLVPLCTLLSLFVCMFLILITNTSFLFRINPLILLILEKYLCFCLQR